MVGSDLSIHDAGRTETDQLTILASAWSERRQELVTTGGDGTIRFSSLHSDYQITTYGRRLMSRLHARICAGPGPPSVTAVGMHPCVLIKALTGAQQRP